MREAKHSERRILGKQPRHKEDGRGQALHRAGRNVHQEPRYGTSVLSAFHMLQMITKHSKVPAFNELGSRLDDVPTLADELNQALFAVAPRRT